MKTPPQALHRISGWLVTVLVPVVLILAAVRLLLTPAFVRLEYLTPNFPPDAYGFTLEDRLHWAPLALTYLLNDADVSFLGDLRFADGSPVYDSRELHHMADTKRLVRVVLWVWYGTLAVLLGLGIWAWRAGWWLEFRRGLARGGWLTVALVVLVIGVALLSFGPLFVIFHRLFFEGDTWLFDRSTTLIRLFPMRFWRDAFVLVGGLALTGGLALALGAAPRKREP